MKKLRLLGTVLTVMALILLAACGGGANNNTPAPNNNQAGEGTQEQPAENKVLRVVTNAAFPPFENLENGEIVGFDADLLKALMEELDMDYQFEHIGWDAMFIEIDGGVEKATADMAVAAITINEDRIASYDFTSPYFLSTQMILFKEGTNIESAQDLLGKKVGVQLSTTGAEAAYKVLGDKSPDVLNYENIILAMMSLDTGDVDAVVADNSVMEEFFRNNPDKEYQILIDEENFEVEYYGICFPQDSPLREQVEQALQTLFDNGTYAEIYEKWFGMEPDIEQLRNAQ